MTDRRFFQDDFEKAAELIADSIRNDSYLSDDSADYVDAHLQVLNLMVRRRISTLADGTIEDTDSDPSTWSDERLEAFYNDIGAYEGPVEHLRLAGLPGDWLEEHWG
jgi:hypothetical protein